MTRSEAKVASLFLEDPDRAIAWPITTLASKAGVSEPSVARFCRAIGFSGLKDFKLALAKSLGASGQRPSRLQGHDRTASGVAENLIDFAIEALQRLRNELDAGTLDAIAERIAGARRLEFYGQGNSGIVALDGQHKFFRLGLATSASSDPHVHSMSAALLGPQDVVIAISASGRTLDLIHTIGIARNAGAYIVGLTDRGSPLTQVCDAILAVDMQESPVANAPTTSRLMHLAVLDMLAVLVADRLGPDRRNKAEKARAIVIGKRISSVAEEMK